MKQHDIIMCNYQIRLDTFLLSLNRVLALRQRNAVSIEAEVQKVLNCSVMYICIEVYMKINSK